MPVEIPERSLIDWLKEVSPSLRRIGNEMFPVLLTPEMLDLIPLTDLEHLARKPINKQIPLMKAGRWFIKHKRPLIFCVEPGGGKTFITIGSLAPSIYETRAKGEIFRVVIIAPGHLSHNWYREIHMVIPDAKIRIAHHAGDVIPVTQVKGVSYKPVPRRKVKRTKKNSVQLVDAYPNAPLAEAEFIILNYHAASLSAKIQPAATQGYLKSTVTQYANGRAMTVEAIHRDRDGVVKVLVCPDCGAIIKGKKDQPIDTVDLEEDHRLCRAPRKRRYSKDNGTIWKPDIEQRYAERNQTTKRGEPKLCGGALWQYTADPLPTPHDGFGGKTPGQRVQQKVVTPEQWTDKRTQMVRPPAWDREIWGLDGRIIAHRSPTAVRKALRNEEPKPLRPLGSLSYTLVSPTSAKTYTHSGSRKMDLATIFKKKKYPYHLNHAVVDEGHLAKGGDSARGMATANICALADAQFMLTGTLAGGYSSTLFYLLWRFTRDVRNDFPYDGVAQWVERYGVRQLTFRASTDKDWEESKKSGKQSKRKSNPPSIREIPGLSASAMRHILADTVFASLNEIFPYPLIPHYQDFTRSMPLDDTQHATITYQVRGSEAGELEDIIEEVSQARAYSIIERVLRNEARALLLRNDRGLLAIMLQTLLRWPNACTFPIEIVHPRTKEVFLKFPGLPKEWLFPKERWLLEQCHQWKREGHRAIVYVAHTGDIDVGARLKEVLEREYEGHTLKVAFLRSTTVAPEDREDWIRQEVADGADILLCNPQLVETGLNLIQFSRVCMYQMIYSAYTLAQCVRRVLRPGQPHDIEVMYPQYRGAFELLAAKLMAMKKRVLAQVAGQLEDAFTAAGAGDLDGMALLAKRIQSGLSLHADDDDELQQIFDDARVLEERKVQDEIEEFRRNFGISEDAAEKLKGFLDDGFDPFAIELDFSLLAELVANLTPEDQEALLNPFGDEDSRDDNAGEQFSVAPMMTQTLWN